MLQLFVNFVAWFYFFELPTPRRIEVILTWPDRCLRYVTLDLTLRPLRYIEANIALRHVWELTTVDVFFLFTGGLR